MFCKVQMAATVEFAPEIGGVAVPPLPVIVFIHGGAFCIGSSDPRMYGPEYFIDKGVVYVSVNYRLGPLGFFSLGNDLAPGNQVRLFLTLPSPWHLS